MTTKSITLKIIFGVLIFAFSLALAYFTASYVDKNKIFDYWGTLLLFAAVYIIVGIVVSKIFPISLGFLFSADILILNVLFENFGDWLDITKAFILSIILLILYLVAWFKFQDEAVNPQSFSEPS